MIREITDHQVNAVNDGLILEVMDEPGAGGACHEYRVTFLDEPSSPAPLHINFQNGPIAENGVNGITHEVLLAIIADRLKSFQAGPYACVENEDALSHVRSALYELQRRTKARMERGVEGTSTV